jgi:hypothetical protein
MRRNQALWFISPVSNWDKRKSKSRLTMAESLRRPPSDVAKLRAVTRSRPTREFESMPLCDQFKVDG